MFYNHNRFNKINDRKKMKKVKKQWVVVSTAILGLVGSGLLYSSKVETVHADANTSSIVNTSDASSGAASSSEAASSDATSSNAPAVATPSTSSSSDAPVANTSSTPEVHPTSNSANSTEPTSVEGTSSTGDQSASATSSHDAATTDHTSASSSSDHSSSNDATSSSSSNQTSSGSNNSSQSSSSATPTVANADQKVQSGSASSSGQAISVAANDAKGSGANTGLSSNSSNSNQNAYYLTADQLSQLNNGGTVDLDASMLRDGDTSDQPVYSQGGISKYADGHVEISGSAMESYINLSGKATNQGNGTIQLIPQNQQTTDDFGNTTTTPVQGVGGAFFNSSLDLSKGFSFKANFQWGGDGIGMLFTPVANGSKLGSGGGNLGIVGVPNVYGFKIDNFNQNGDDNGAPGSPYATFVDTDQNGKEIGANGVNTSDPTNLTDIPSGTTFTNKYLSSNSSNYDSSGNSHTSGLVGGSSGDVTFNYTPNQTVAGDTQSGVLSVTFPSKTSTSGTQTIYHTLNYSAKNPAYYFAALASNGGAAQATQLLNLQSGDGVSYTPQQQATVKIVDGSNNNNVLNNATFKGEIGGTVDSNGDTDALIQKYQNAGIYCHQ